MRDACRYIYLTLRVAIAAVAAIMAAACGGVSSDGPDRPVDTPEGADMYLSFTIVTRQQDESTRAADIGGDRTGSAAENYIDLNDLTYLIFDKEGKYLFNATPYAYTLAADDAYAVYSVTARLNGDPYFSQNIGSTIEISVLVLANYGAWGVTLPEAKRGETTIQKYFGMIPSTPAGMLPQTYQLINADELWSRQRIPMAGLQRLSIDGQKLAESSFGEPYDISREGGKDINMLRMLAKIEVIDKINIPAGDVWNEAEDNTGAMASLRIAKVELLGVVDRGSLLPEYGQWSRNVFYPETQQVSAPSVPADAKYIRSLPWVDKGVAGGGYPPGSVIDFERDDDARSERDDYCPVFSAYVFEYHMDMEKETQYQPYLRLTTQGGKADTPEGKTETYESSIFPMRMAEYSGGSATNNIKSLLRNHIYRYEVSGIRQEVEVKWTVCDMTAATAPDIEFN